MGTNDYQFLDVPRNCIEAVIPICPLCHDTKCTEIPLQTVILTIDAPYRTECHSCKRWWNTRRTKIRI
jgi:hypothetical protein